MDQSDNSAGESLSERMSRYPARRIILVVAAVLFIVAIPPILNYFFPVAGLEAASIITSGILSLALVILYFQQYSMLDRQTSLMEREYRTGIAVRGQVFADGDTLYLTLRNTGRGTIPYMYLKSEIISDTETIGDSAGYYQLRTIRDDKRLLAGQSGVDDFKGDVKIRVPDNRGDERDITFEHFSNELIRAGIEQCTVRLTLEVIDEKDQAHESPEKLQIAEQEIELGRAESQSAESEGSESEKSPNFVSTKFSEGIPRVFPQPIMPREVPLIGWPEKFRVEDD